MRLVLIICLMWMLPLLLSADEQSSIAGFSHSEALRLGERMYREGILPNGEPMQAIVVGDTQVQGSMFTCVNCHQRSGLGSVEGSVITWPIGANDLSVPRRRTGAWHSKKTRQGPGAVQRWSLPKQYQAADARPAFNDETLARMLRTGITPSGSQAMDIMPRYKLADNDMAVLVHYLKNLSAISDPGIDDKVIHFATVITEGVSDIDRNAMLDVLKKHIKTNNTQTRPHLRRAKKGPFYKTERFGAYRKIELDVWELTGPEETWRQQLEEHYKAKPVFALLGGISSGSWKPVHDFCEDNELPNIFPVTEHPVISDSDWYTLYFDKGLYQEGEAAARFIFKSQQMNKNIIQVFAAQTQGEEIAHAFEANWKKLGGKNLTNKIIKSADELSLQWLNENISNASATVLLWLDKSSVNTVLQSENFKNKLDNKVFLSNTLLAGETDIIPQNMRESIFFTHPYSLPGNDEQKNRVLKRWLKISGIPETNLNIQAKMYFLGWMLPGAIKHMRSEFYRDYFLEGYDMMIEQTYAVAVYPRLSFGPGQRYASKGCYIAQLTGDDSSKLKMVGDWVTN